MPINPVSPRLPPSAPFSAGALLGALGCLLTLLGAQRTGHADTAPGVGAGLIDQAAESALRQLAGASSAQLVLTPAPLDPRLRLPACDQPLRANVTDGQVRAQTTLAVRCEGSVRWTIYTSVAVQTEAQVLIARYALPRDAALTIADFQLSARRVPGLIDDYLTNPASLAGQRLKRPLVAGEPLSIDALAPALLIRRGQQVILLARSPRLEVRVAGVALADGRATDHIRVQNLSSQRVVEGVVRADGIVETPL